MGLFDMFRAAKTVSEARVILKKNYGLDLGEDQLTQVYRIFEGSLTPHGLAMASVGRCGEFICKLPEKDKAFYASQWLANYHYVAKGGLADQIITDNFLSAMKTFFNLTSESPDKLFHEIHAWRVRVGSN